VGAAAIAGVVAGAIALPHILPLQRVAPVTASGIWLLALALRALVAVGAAVFVFVFLPQTSLFEAVARWCLHNLAPLLTEEFGLSGHSVADAAVVLPSLVLSGSALWVLFGMLRAGVALRLYLQRRSRGYGPLGSTVVEDSEVVVAATGLGRARLVVSQVALGTLDGDELAAGLAHELGHLRRRHRTIVWLGALFRSLGRLLPGTAAAERALIFSLERDADEYAVHETRDPLALASAICKAARGRAPALSAALAGRGGVSLRLEYLLSGGRRRGGRALERSMRLLALLMGLV
jgi:bla regulator protein blaR1